MDVQSFKYKSGTNFYMQTKQIHRCFECGRNFPRGWNLKRHYEDVHHYPKIQNMESDPYIGMSIENYRNKKEA